MKKFVLARASADLPLPSAHLIYVRDAPNHDRHLRSLKLHDQEDYPKFGAKRWRFAADHTDPILLTTHSGTDERKKESVFMQVEHFFRSILLRCVRDGAKHEHLVHIFMDANGMDYRFVFNPAGPKAVTIGDLLQGGKLKDLITQFSEMIQSGKEVYLDDKTIVELYTFEIPSGGGRLTLGNADLFTMASKGIRRVINPDDKMCLARCMVLDQARKNKEKPNLYKDLCKTQPDRVRRLSNMALQVYQALGKNPQEVCTLTQDYQRLADYFKVNLVIYKTFETGEFELEYVSDIKGYSDHTFVYHTVDHYDLITDILTVVRAFTHNQRTQYCLFCHRFYDGRYSHECNEEDPLPKKEKKTPMLDGEELSHWRVDEELIVDAPVLKFIQPSAGKEATFKRVIYLDFETYPKAFGKITKQPKPEEAPVTEFMDMEPYIPYSYEHTVLDSRQFEYRQTVNHCEVQWGEGTPEETRVFSNMKDTMTWLGLPENKGALVVAHCGGRFDFQLMFEYYLSPSILKGTNIEIPLLKGNKIMGTTIHNDIQLVDSYNFVSTALAKFPKMFDIPELKKGFFPHRFNQPKFWNYKGPIPAKEWYEYNLFSADKRKEFLEWHADQVAQKVEFDFQQEMQAYCHSDVSLLRVGMTKFRALFMELEDVNGRPIGADPFCYLTIAAVAFNGIYLRNYLPENTLMVVPRPSKDIYSPESIQWLEYEMKQRNIHIRHAMNTVEGEKFLKIKRWGAIRTIKVDGWDEENSTVYQYHGCFYHGCPRCYEAHANNPMKLKKYTDKKDGQEKTIPMKHGELYSETKWMTHHIRQSGYDVVEMWSCDWKKQSKNLPDLIPIQQLDKLKPLIPRDAYFGGRTNAFKLYYKCLEPERIHYIDITSCYPAVMSLPQYYYPIGIPKMLRDADSLIPLADLFGLMKCKVKPPRHLYTPVLPERVVSDSGEIKMQYHLKEMTGTWTSMELQQAVEEGYEILEIYEQHHFEQKSNTLFKEYNQTFFDIKKKAKEEGNKGLEAVAKMCINAPSGKWGYNPSKQSKTLMVKDSATFFKYLLGKYEKADMKIVSKDVVLVGIHENDEMTEHLTSNVYISAFITAYGRLKLYKEALKPLGKKVLYFDTDSVVYVSPTGEHLVPICTTGELGGWASETSLDDYFTEFVSGGPKTYALKSFSGKKDVAKCKGFSLHFDNAKIFNFESLRDQAICKALNINWERLVLHMNEPIMRRNLFQIHVVNNPGKILNMNYDKRSILWPNVAFKNVKVVDTLPWGHELGENASNEEDQFK